MDAYLRGYFLTALGYDLATTENCAPDIALELIAGCDWWQRVSDPAGGQR